MKTDISSSLEGSLIMKTRSYEPDCSWDLFFSSLSYWSNGLFTYQVLIIKRVVLYTYLLWPGCSHRTWTNEWIVFKNSCINQVYCVQCWKGQSIFISIGRDIWSKDIWRKTHWKDKGAILDGIFLDLCLNEILM